MPRQIARSRPVEAVLAVLTVAAVIGFAVLWGLGIAVALFGGPLFFANADDFLHRALAAGSFARPGEDPAGSVPVRWFVLDAGAVVDVDVTAAEVLEQLRSQLANGSVVLVTGHLRASLLRRLRRTGWVQRVGEDRHFPTLPTAVAAYERWLADTEEGTKVPADQ